MKLTLWQQFSANHSSSFTVVGRCATIEKAIEVEQILRKLLDDIAENLAFLPRQLVKENDAPTWPEVEAAEKYGIDWERGLDWVYEPVDEHVIRFEQYVFLKNGSIDTWQGAAIPAKLMSRLADEVYVSGEFEHNRVVTDIRTTAPDQKIAGEIAREIRLYLNPATVDDDTIPPWAAYDNSWNRFTIDKLIEAHSSLQTSPDVIRTIIQALYEYQRARMEKRSLHDVEVTALKALHRLLEYGYTFTRKLDSQTLNLIVVETGKKAFPGVSGGQIEHSGSQIHFLNMKFYMDWAYESLPAFFKYLKAKGCTDIQYSFKNVPYHTK